MTFADAQRYELANARRKFPALHSAHEGYAVILEELDEFWEQVRTRDAGRDPRKMLAELVQTAAMCQRTAEDLGLTDEINT